MMNGWAIPAVGIFIVTQAAAAVWWASGTDQRVGDNTTAIEQVVQNEKQIAIIIAGTKGHLDDIPIGKVQDFENGLLDYLDANYSSELKSIRTEGTISDEAGNKLDEAILAFKGGFTA